LTWCKMNRVAERAMLGFFTESILPVAAIQTPATGLRSLVSVNASIYTVFFLLPCHQTRSPIYSACTGDAPVLVRTTLVISWARSAGRRHAVTSETTGYLRSKPPLAWRLFTKPPCVNCSPADFAKSRNEY
jgi:hypothetical protein